ncbi:MAG: hypothetical protein ABIJ01_10605 [Pseudomonadota bacterium]
MSPLKLLVYFLTPIGVAVTALIYSQNCMADIRATVVKFNTVCAHCHEGQCSGRLSFSSGVAAAQGHVRRYIPSSSPLEVEELFAILKYTKEECAHYPLPDTAPADGTWNAEVLHQWRGPDGKSYFIPLGRIRPGTYHLNLRFDGQSEASMSICGEKLDVLLEEQQRTDQVFEHTLPIAAEGLYYLHLKSTSTLLDLTFTPARQQ